MASIKEKLIKGGVWTLIGHFGSLGVSIIANIWLARLLSPVEFGQIGIIMFFIAIANAISESGMAGALIRKKDVSSEDYATVFIFNLTLSIFCYVLIVIASSSISHFYQDSALQAPLIAASLVLIINAFQITQTARLMSEMRHKQNSIYVFCSTIFASVVGIYAAYIGLGIWSLVIMQVLKSLINTILLWVLEGFYFKLRFNRGSFDSMYKFGKNTTIAVILNRLFDNVYQLVLGKYFSLSQAGFYYQAKKIQELPGVILTTVISNVVFPALSKLQDDKAYFSITYNKIISSFVVFLGLATILLYFYAYDVVKLILGDDWVQSAWYIQLLTIASFFYVQGQFNRVIFKIFDKTHIILNLEIVKKIFQSITVVCGILFHSIEVLLIGFLLSNMLSFVLSFLFSNKVLGSFNAHEMLSVVKIIWVCTFVVILSAILRNNVEFLDEFSILFVLIIIPLYFLLLRTLKLFDIFLLFDRFNFRNIRF